MDKLNEFRKLEDAESENFLKKVSKYLAHVIENKDKVRVIIIAEDPYKKDLTDEIACAFNYDNQRFATPYSVRVIAEALSPKNKTKQKQFIDLLAICHELVHSGIVLIDTYPIHSKDAEKKFKYGRKQANLFNEIFKTHTIERVYLLGNKCQKNFSNLFNFKATHLLNLSHPARNRFEKGVLLKEKNKDAINHLHDDLAPFLEVDFPTLFAKLKI